MYLLDTHALLWFLNDDPMLPAETKSLIESSEYVYVSIATFWEMAIKKSIRKLELARPITKVMSDCEKLGFSVLPIKAAHLERIGALPHIHRDPFDRLLVCQAQAEGMTLVTTDGNIPKYNVRTLWQA